jgi:hypothetical protein
MKAAFTARRLEPGVYRAFREAWEPERLPAELQRAFHLRNPSDPDEIVSFGLLDGDDEMVNRLRDDPAEREREQRIARFVVSTDITGMYDVVHSVNGVSVGGCTIVHVTARRLRPSCYEAYLGAVRLAIGDDLPRGLATLLVLRSCDRPDEVIQIGIVHTDNPEEYSGKSAERRRRIAASVAPFVSSVELDASYDLLEELVPIHA